MHQNIAFSKSLKVNSKFWTKNLGLNCPELEKVVSGWWHWWPMKLYSQLPDPEVDPDLRSLTMTVFKSARS